MENFHNLESTLLYIERPWAELAVIKYQYAKGTFKRFIQYLLIKLIYLNSDEGTMFWTNPYEFEMFKLPEAFSEAKIPRLTAEIGKSSKNVFFF